MPNPPRITGHRFGGGENSQRAAAPPSNVKWPWAYAQPDATDAPDDKLYHRAIAFSEHMVSSIVDMNEEQYLERLGNGRGSTTRVKVDPLASVYTIHASAVFAATLAEVLALFEDDPTAQSDPFLSRTFGPSLVSSSEIRRLKQATVTATTMRIHSKTKGSASGGQLRSQSRSSNSDDDTKSSSGSSASSALTITSTHDIRSLAIKKALLQESRTALNFVTKPAVRDLVFVDYLEQRSDAAFVRTIKSIDGGSESRTPRGGSDNGPVDRHQHLLLSYLVQAINPATTATTIATSRVRVSFVGHYCYEDGLIDDTKRLLTKFADAVEMIPKWHFQQRLAASLFGAPPPAVPPSKTPRDPAFACRVCARTFTAFMKQRVCRVCSQDVCSSCSTAEQVPTNDLILEVRVCVACVASIKQGTKSPFAEPTPAAPAILLAPGLLKALSNASLPPTTPAPSSSNSDYPPSQTPSRMLSRSMSALSIPTSSRKHSSKAASVRHQALLHFGRHQTLFDVACTMTARRMGCDSAAVSLIEPTGQFATKAVHGASGPHDLFLHHVVASASMDEPDDDEPCVFVVEDALTDDRFADSPARGARFFYGLPLVVPGGVAKDDQVVVGVVSVSDTKPRTDLLQEAHDAIMFEFQQTVLKLLGTATPTTAT